MARAPQFKNVSVSTLREAKHNPKRRMEGAKIRQLAKSMGNVGLLQPILISAENQIIDGHRRFRAAKLNGWETIPALVVAGDANAIYAEVNVNSQRPSGNDVLNVFLVEPMAVTAHSRTKLQKIEEVIGRPLLETMAKHGFSIFIYRIAVEVCKACGKGESDEWIKRTVRWFMTCESFGYVRNLLATKTISPMLVLRHVKTNQPLRVKVS